MCFAFNNYIQCVPLFISVIYFLYCFFIQISNGNGHVSESKHELYNSKMDMGSSVEIEKDYKQKGMYCHIAVSVRKVIKLPSKIFVLVFRESEVSIYLMHCSDWLFSRSTNSCSKVLSS